ncbi:MAG: FAD-binding protein, partial [Crocinitomicaceae bacterium]|nr:FAD-binding protein [Crocinitomicaceae bacterium]
MDSIHQPFFKELLGDRFLLNPDQTAEYGSDETEDLFELPLAVLLPETVEEVSSIMKYCYENSLSVTPSGARTGLSGGAIPGNQ